MWSMRSVRFSEPTGYLSAAEGGALRALGLRRVETCLVGPDGADLVGVAANPARMI